MTGVDAGLIAAWLATRSMVRDLPAPVPDRGGWRVDTNLPGERRRHVFPLAVPGLAELGATVTEPLVMLKLADGHAALAALLPPRWRLEPLAQVMTCDGRFGGGEDRPAPPPGYRLSVERDGDRAFATILASDGSLAASGHAGERDGVFIYDRIMTDAAHRRRGLGRTLMLALQTTRRSAGARQLLTATADGRALYGTLGWHLYCPWSTATIPARSPGRAPSPEV